jgi:hypothetical protein
MPEALYRGKALAYRGAAYFYLKTLFGGTPLTTNSETPANSIPRASEQEMNNSVRADFEAAIENIPVAAADSVRLLLSVQALQTPDFARAKTLLETIRNSGLYKFRDINGDGTINADDRDAQNIFFFQILLLSAEASVNTGNNAEAISLVNIPYGQLGMSPVLSPGTTLEGTRVAIRNLFTTWNDGLKFLNATRWDDPDNWGYRALMPIPQQAMETNPNLQQNPGW